MNGLHLIADLYACNGDKALLLDKDTLENLCTRATQAAGLTSVGCHFHQFTYDNGEKAGVTGAIVLAESHLAIHTWPESGDVTLDVYVCNYSRDNSDCAKGLFQTIIAALQPEHVVEKTVTRGEVNTRCRIAA